MDEYEILEELRDLIERSEGAAFSDVTLRRPDCSPGCGASVVLDFPNGTFLLTVEQIG